MRLISCGFVELHMKEVGRIYRQPIPTVDLHLPYGCLETGRCVRQE